jgi:hypothetical protein
VNDVEHNEVVEPSESSPDPSIINDKKAANTASPPKKTPQWDPNKNHGRYGAKDYPGCDQVFIKHKELSVGAQCPECAKHNTPAKLYPFHAGVLIRLDGQPLVIGTCYTMESFRCYLCGKIYTADIPQTIAQQPKCSVSVCSNVAIAHYYLGLPFKRIELWQSMGGIPLADATQWDLMKALGKNVAPVHQCLYIQSAQGKGLYYDDTPQKILDTTGVLTGSRKGMYTTAVISEVDEHRIYLFFTGGRHAGENIKLLLDQRTCKDDFFTMSDASANNLPKDVDDTVLARWVLCFCLVHSRRKFFEVLNYFGEDCRFVLEQIGTIYYHEKICKQRGYSPEQRLAYHQLKSAPLFKALRIWLNNKLLFHDVEPNGGFGEAIQYLLRHWDALTRFLHYPGVPLDNSLCEQMIKVAIRYRKNSLFYKTIKGAQVGDCLMSVIHTAARAGVNVLEYLNALQTHAERVKQSPTSWLPWNYAQTLAQLSSAIAV